MSFAIAGGALAAVGGIYAANKQAGAAKDAAAAQSASADAGIAEQQRQFDAIQALLAPFVSQGTNAFQQQGNIVGVNGAAPQAAAISALENSPEMQAYMQQGENAILQNASATGGLRGGNTQAALAQFRPNLLAAMIGQQYNRLGGIAGAGQNAATMQGAAGQNSANAISLLLQQQGAAQAGGYIGAGAAQAGYGNALLGGLGTWRGLGGGTPITPSSVGYGIPGGMGVPF